MPWHISAKKEGCSGYAVVKDSDGSLVGCHPTKKDANAQLAALYASESRNNVTHKNIWDGSFLPTDDLP